MSSTYHVFPPYGLITEAFLPLGAYLVFVGIFASAGQISRNAELRREFYKSAASQLTLLKAIGVSHMEKELEKNVEFVNRRSRLLGTADIIQEKDENVKEILHEVLEEIYSKKTNSIKSPSTIPVEGGNYINNAKILSSRLVYRRKEQFQFSFYIL